MDRLLLKVEEAAKMLGLCRSKVYAMARRNEIPVVRFGKSVRVPSDRLRAWIDAQAQTEQERGEL